MDKKAILLFLKNAVANVIRGGAAALVAIVLPPFLTRLMSLGAFNAWTLVLQLSAWVGYLDFGVQTAVGRFVAYANESGDSEQRDRIASTSLAALSAAAILAITGAVLAAFLLPQIFRQMPSALVPEARVALLLVASSLAIGLPASVFNGIFIGQQRNEVPAAIIAGSRTLGAVLQILVVERGGNLPWMGLAVAAVNLSSYLVQYLMYRRLAPTVRLSKRLVSAKAGVELFDYCLSLSVWSFAMLLVTGLDVVLVGYFQFEELAPYAVAATLITFLAGLQDAIFKALISPTAVLHANGNSSDLGRVVITATRYGTFLLLLTGLPLVFGAKSILTLWLGSAYAVRGAHILQLLVVANMIRYSATPYIITLIGAGQQHLVTVTPVLEGVSNLLASLVAGRMFGATGVALGTLFGAVVGISGNFFYNMPRTAGIAFRISDYLRDGLLRPAICALPLTAYMGVVQLADMSPTVTRYLWLVCALVATGFLTWSWGLVSSERERLRSWHIAYSRT
jgi:O-antigen/teichoic acid export membrane protein